MISSFQSTLMKTSLFAVLQLYGYIGTATAAEDSHRQESPAIGIRPADRIWKEGGARCRVVCGGTLWERKQRKQHLSRCVEARRG